MIKAIMTCDSTPNCDALLISPFGEERLLKLARESRWHRFLIKQAMVMDLCPTHARKAHKDWKVMW